MAMTLSLWPKLVSASASETMIGRASAITWRTMLSEMLPSGLVIAALWTLREARTLSLRSTLTPVATGAGSPSTRRMKPLSALVSSMTSLSMAESSSSTLRRLMSFSLKAKSLRTPASSLETPWLLGGMVGASSSSISRGGDQLGEHGEDQLGAAELDPVPVGEAHPPLALAVDGDVRVAIELFEDEVAPVEEDLRVVLGDPVAPDRHVVAERPADGGDRLVDAVLARGAGGGEVLQRRHRRPA